MKVVPITYVTPEDEKLVLIQDEWVPNIVPVYYISNKNRVYNSKTGKYLYGHLDKDNYYRVALQLKDGTYTSRGLHRLMLLGFNYNPNHRNLVPNHLDGEPYHNVLDNLEWTDGKGNARHAVDTGLHKMYGKDNPNGKLTEDQVREICKLIETGEYYDTEIADIYGVSYVNISDIHKGKIWKNISKDYDLSKRKYKGLTPDQARQVCEMIETGNYTNKEIADKFNSTVGIVNGIKNKKCWTEISKDYDVSKSKPKKFTESQIREICELIQSGNYYDTEIAKMYNTTPTQLKNLRDGIIWKDVIKDYDLTIRKGKRI